MSMRNQIIVYLKLITNAYTDEREEAYILCAQFAADKVVYCNGIMNEIEENYQKNVDECYDYNTSIPELIKENDQKKEKYESDINNCKKKKQNACVSEIESYANVAVLSGKLLDTACEDGSEVYYCDSRLFDGKCRSSNCKEDDEEYSNAASSAACLKTCYKPIVCGDNNLTSFDLQFVCHGYFKLYRSKKVAKKIVVEDTGMRICPELLSSKAYSNKFSYSSDSDKRFIKFFPSDYGGVINEKD